MRILSKEEISRDGKMILIYGGTGVGKTTSIIQSSPDPMILVQTEARSLGPSIEAANRPDLKIKVAVYENWMDLIEFLSNPKNFEEFKTVVVDSYSHLMSVGLSQEIEDQAYEARSQEEKKVKSLVSQTKLSQEGFGALSSLMIRVTAALGRLSRSGKIVIVTCLLSESPKWDRDLAAAPALKGREFPVNMPGFFDLIGMVETRTDGDGKIVYPPRVRFQSPDDSFVAKFTGSGRVTEGPLNITKILQLGSKNKSKEEKV